MANLTALYQRICAARSPRTRENLGQAVDVEVGGHERRNNFASVSASEAVLTRPLLWLRRALVVQCSLAVGVGSHLQ